MSSSLLQRNLTVSRGAAQARQLESGCVYSLPVVKRQVPRSRGWWNHGSLGKEIAMKGFHKAWILITAVVFTAIPMTVRAQDAGNTSGKSIQMVGARASLSKGIDAKKAKQGDVITAKLDDDVKIPGEITLPRIRSCSDTSIRYSHLKTKAIL